MTYIQVITCIETLKRYYGNKFLKDVFHDCPKSNKRLKVNRLKIDCTRFMDFVVFDSCVGNNHNVGYFENGVLILYTDVYNSPVEISTLKNFFRYFKIPLDDII